MKNKKFVFAVLCALLLSVVLCACSDNTLNDSNEKNPSTKELPKAQESEVLSDSSATSAAEAPVNKEIQPNLGAQTPVAPTQAPSQENTKYGKDDVYTNDSGVPAAKTESGTEVELTSENLQKLMEEYQKIQNSGSERERELLDQIQVILETMQFAQGN